MPKRIAIPGLLATLFLSTAAVAAPDLVGAWSAAMPGQGGMTQITAAYDAGGNYVSVQREPNGTLLRIWGSYRAVPVSATQLRLETQVQGWSPHQVCAQAPGFAVKCGDFTPPAAPPATLEFSSPESFRVQGVVAHRDNAPALLQMNVPDRIVLAAPAPVRPVNPPDGGRGGGGHVTPVNPVNGAARDELQQRRICSINGGNLVVASGRLTCVN